LRSFRVLPFSGLESLSREMMKGQITLKVQPTLSRSRGTRDYGTAASGAKLTLSCRFS
jgi:hypothetical protein